LYCQPKSKVEADLKALLPNITIHKETKRKPDEKEIIKVIQPELPSITVTTSLNSQETKSPKDFEIQKQEYLSSEIKKEQSKKHQQLQTFVKSIAVQRGYKVTLEHPIKNDKRIDVSLERNDFKIAIEISVTNSIAYEIRNLQKCLKAEYNTVAMLCENQTHLLNIKEQALKTIDKKEHHKLHFIPSNNFTAFLDSITPKEKTIEKRIKGYRVKTNYTSKPVQADKKKSLSQIILNKLRKKK